MISEAKKKIEILKKYNPNFTKQELFFESDIHDNHDLAIYTDKYSQACKTTRGAIFFGVCRGRLSEGFDFANKLCRGLITVGVPYMVHNEETKQKKAYNDTLTIKSQTDNKPLTGQEWYKIDAMRALNQALGRSVRNANDWAAIIMIDSRFTEQNNYKYISTWISDACPFKGQRLNLADIENDLQDFITRKTSQKREVQ